MISYKLMIASFVATAGFIVGLTEVSSHEPSIELRYALIQYYRGESVFALDTDLSLTDCLDSLPKDQLEKYLQFRCEIDPASN